jgi:hypothetical protein
MPVRLISLIAFVLVAFAARVDAQTTPVVTTPYRQVYVFAGPGHTHAQRGTINADTPINVIARNRAGTWVQIQRVNGDGSIALDGWMIAGYLRQPPELRHSVIPIDWTVTDHVPSNAAYASFSELYATPVLPRVDELMVEIYQMGQTLGNRPDGVTKVGDSLIVSPQILNFMGRTDNVLGPYDTLAPTIQYYANGVTPYSVANTVGMSTFTVLDPMWAPAGTCQPNESPLACEYRIRKPSVAFVLFGPNDLRAVDAAQYGANIRRIVADSLAAGIIPVLSTFSLYQDEQYFWEGIEFNRELARIAAETHVPLINLWAAARTLPDYGLDADRVHMRLTGSESLRLDAGQEAFSAAALYNVLALTTLGDIRAAVGA